MDGWPPGLKDNKHVSVTWAIRYLTVCYENHMKLTQQVTTKYMLSQTNDFTNESFHNLYNIPSYISYISYCYDKTPKGKQQAGGRVYVGSQSEEVKSIMVGKR